MSDPTFKPVELEYGIVSQSEEDVAAWQTFLDTFAPKGLIELGTLTGNFSRWLADRVPWFRTIDNVQPADPPSGFILADVFEDEEIVMGLMDQAASPLCLFCDDGNKKLEVATYAPDLITGDFLAVHDFGYEIHRRDIPKGFRLVGSGGLTCFFRKT